MPLRQTAASAQLPPIAQRFAVQSANTTHTTLKHKTMLSPTPPVPAQQLGVGHVTTLRIRRPEICICLLQRLIAVRQRKIRQHADRQSAIPATETRHLDPVSADVTFIRSVPVKTTLSGTCPANIRTSNNIKRVASGHVGCYIFNRA